MNCRPKSVEDRLVNNNHERGHGTIVARFSHSSATAKRSLFRMDLCGVVFAEVQRTEVNEVLPDTTAASSSESRLTPAPDTESRDRLRNPQTETWEAGLQWLHDKDFLGGFLICR